MSSDIHALSGAYAVDALDDLERAQFEQHLSECDACRWEVDSLLEASAVLAEAASASPPAALRARVLAGIETVRPLPPVVPLPVTAERRRRRFPALVAAAAVVALLGAGTVAWDPFADETTQTVPLADRVLTAPDAERWTEKPVTGGIVTVTRSERLNGAVVQTKDLPPLPPGRVYELWLQHDGVMVPAGLITDHRAATVVLAGDPATAQATAISIEPAEGSGKPTTFPIATFEFEQV